MDSVTQFVLGAAVQGAGMGKYQGRKALLYGGLLGTLPDLDVFIQYADPISRMTYHRGFSHSLFVLTALALLITAVTFMRRRKPEYSFKRLFIVLTLTLITHPLIDAMTTFGTQLFWPLGVTPSVWATIFIVDPIYTVPLIVTCLWALWRNSATSRKAMGYALAFGVLYFAWGFTGRFYHEQRVTTELANQGIKVERVLATPTAFNTILWNVMAIDHNGKQYNALSGWFDRKPPEILAQPRNLGLRIGFHSPQLDRLNWFSDHWLNYQEIDQQLVVSVARMGFASMANARFIVAQRDSDGVWQAVTPERLRAGFIHDNKAALRELWRNRIWGDDNALPMAQWAELK